MSDVWQRRNADSSNTCWTSSCTATWSYDGRGRLKQEVNGAGVTSAFTLDTIGNVTAETATGQPPVVRTFSGQQLTSETVGGTTTSFVYDPSGNVDCEVSGSYTQALCPTSGSSLKKDYIYDYANRLTGVRESSGGMTDSIDYVLDPLGRTVAQTEIGSPGSTTTFAYLGTSGQVSEETEPTETRTYAYDPFGQRVSMNYGYNSASQALFQYDPHGSVSLVWDAYDTNDLLATYGYEAYGSQDDALSSSNPSSENAYTYTGRRWDDASGTYEMGARRYNPQTGGSCSRTATTTAWRTSDWAWAA